VSGAEAGVGRRQFLSRFIRETVAEPVAAAHHDLRREERLEADRDVLESELRAFGPDVVADLARRSGLPSDDADCTAVAEVLVQNAEADGDDGR